MTTFNYQEFVVGIMTLRNRVPERVAGPIGFGSLVLMILGTTFGYILALTGISTYFGHTIPASDLTGVEALIITGIGVGLIVVGYLGWKGFLYFSY